MRCSYPANTICALALLWASVALGQSRDSKPAAAANAALMYWQAFALMPALSGDQEQLLEKWDKAPLDAKLQELIAASQSSLMYLRRGAKLEHCDWGLDYHDGISLMMPHLAKARTLARFAALDARYQFEQSHGKEASQNAAAMMALARHVGSDPILVSILVRYGIERMASELVAPYAISSI